jgi:hypothetical protein
MITADEKENILHAIAIMENMKDGEIIRVEAHKYFMELFGYREADTYKWEKRHAWKYHYVLKLIRVLGDM